MEVFLHKIGGKEVPKPVRAELRRCTAAEAPAVYALQNEVRAAMPDPSQFVPDTLENITAYVQKDLCIGMWQGGRLGAYAIVRFCGESEHNYAVFWASSVRNGRTGPTRTVPSSTRTIAATACSGSCCKRRCRFSRAISPTSGPPSARRINTVCATLLRPALPLRPGGRCTAAMTAICW